MRQIGFHTAVPNIVYVGRRHCVVRWANGRNEGFGISEFVGPADGPEPYAYWKLASYEYRTLDAAISDLIRLDLTSPQASQASGE
jgi:hypothetical protein